MITYYDYKINIDSQKDYDEFVESVDLFKCKCPCCGHKGAFNLHGLYSRRVFFSSGQVELYVQRVRCTNCNSTHSLFPSCIVPYQRMMVEHQVALLIEIEDTGGINEIGEALPYLEGDYLFSLYEKFHRKGWKQRLISMGLTLKSEIFELIRRSFDEFRVQFLQIGTMRNGLAIANNIN